MIDAPKGYRMDNYHLASLAISVEKQGPNITKASFPLRYGKYSEIRTSEYEFIFNLNGEIKFIRGLDTNWPHPVEQLKRTDGNDWVYYSVGDVGGDKGVNSWLGEYYLPCLPYPSNSIWEINYYADTRIMQAFAAWSQLYGNLYGANGNRFHARAKELIKSIVENHDGILYEKSQKLNRIIGERISVLPPDTRHVDYEVIPLIIADGCLYRCDFCCVKSARSYQARDMSNIQEQMTGLKAFYGRNLENYNGLFLGNHDALASGEELISSAISEAYRIFEFGKERKTTPKLFLFGSVHSLLKSDNALFEHLDQLPFYTYINIGLESNHAKTLAQIGKPLDETAVREVFKKMLDINATYTNIEVTANFVIGKGLTDDHYDALKEMLHSASDSPLSKGAVYLSPLKDSPRKRELLPLVNEIKKESNLPVFIYLIQRL